MAWTSPFTAVTGAVFSAAQWNTSARDNLNYLKTTMEANQLPIGFIVELKVSTNPASLFGYGTWAAYGTGRVTVAIDAGQAEFNTLEETGGEKAHALTAIENGYHDHVTYVAGSNTGIQVDPGSIYTVLSTSGATANTSYPSGTGAAHNNLQPYIVIYRWVRTA